MFGAGMATPPTTTLLMHQALGYKYQQAQANLSMQNDRVHDDHVAFGSALDVVTTKDEERRDDDNDVDCEEEEDIDDDHDEEGRRSSSFNMILTTTIILTLFTAIAIAVVVMTIKTNLL